jgi:hypothetical protein
VRAGLSEARSQKPEASKYHREVRMAHRLRTASIVVGAGLGVIVALATPTAQAPPAKVAQPAPVQAAATLDPSP